MWEMLEQQEAMSRTIIPTASETPKRLRVYAISSSNLVHIFIPFFRLAPSRISGHNARRNSLNGMERKRKAEAYSNDQMFRQHPAKETIKLATLK